MSTASLMIGVAAVSSSVSTETVLVAGIAGLVAGALSMAAGEYVSVSSQRDAEEADIRVEERELSTDPQGELEELAGIYVQRGVDRDLALAVARQLSAAGQGLGAHLRDELGLDPRALARPLQAASVSAASFAGFAALPVVALLLAPTDMRIAAIGVVSLLSLSLLGALGGWLGGAPMGRAAVRVVLGGGGAMATTALVGHLLGAAGIG